MRPAKRTRNDSGAASEPVRFLVRRVVGILRESTRPARIVDVDHATKAMAAQPDRDQAEVPDQEDQEDREGQEDQEDPGHGRVGKDLGRA